MKRHQKNQAEGQNQQDLEPEKTESGGFFQNPKVDLPESQTPQKEDTEKTETKEESQVYKVDKDFCVRDVVSSEVVRDRVKAEGAGRRHKTKGRCGERPICEISNAQREGPGHCAGCNFAGCGGESKASARQSSSCKG